MQMLNPQADNIGVLLIDRDQQDRVANESANQSTLQGIDYYTFHFVSPNMSSMHSELSHRVKAILAVNIPRRRDSARHIKTFLASLRISNLM